MNSAKSLSTHLQLLLAVLFSVIVSQAQAGSKSDVYELMAITGLNDQISAYPEAIKMGFQQGLAEQQQLSPELSQQLLDSIDATILPEVILAEIEGVLAKKLAKSDISQLMEWYKSNPGLQITEAEKGASTTEGYMDMMSKAQQLMGNSERVAMAKRLDTLLGASDTNIAVQKSTSKAIFSAMMRINAPDEAISTDFFDAQLAMMEPQMRQSIEELVVLNFLYSYADIDDASMKKYETFLNTPAARKFYTATTVGLKAGLEKVVANWAEELAIIMQKQSVEK